MAVAVALAATGLLGVASGEAGGACPTSGGWHAVPYPPQLGRPLVDVAVDQSRPEVLAATDGTDVAFSHDGGCTWDLAQRPSAADPRGDDLLIADLAVAGDGNGTRWFALGLGQVPTAEVAPVLFASDDDGRSWITGGSGLPAARALTPSGGCGPERHCQLETVPGEPDVVYVRLTDLFGLTPLWGSSDGGRTFTQRASTVRVTTQSFSFRSIDLTDVVPISQDLVVAADAYAGIVVSSDGGRTFSTLLEPSGGEARVVAAEAVDLATQGYPDAVVVQSGIGTGPTSIGYGIYPDGRFGQQRSVIGVVADLDLSVDGVGVAVTSEGVYRIDAGTSVARPVPLAGGDLAGMARVQVTGRGADSVVWVSDAERIVRGAVPLVPDLPLEPPPTPTLRELPAFDPFDPARAVPGEIRGDVASIALAPGASQVVDWVLDVPFTPTPLDIYFVFDRTGSMGPEFDALAEGMTQMVNALIDRDIDVHVGLATYGGDERTRQWRDIGPPDEQFQRILENVRAGGDGEFAVTALHEAATGGGLDGGANYAGIDPGHNAHWRDGALRLIVHATDETLKEENGPNDRYDRDVEHRGPTYDQAVEALVAQRILHVGLILGDLETPFSEGGWPRMHGFARETGALAPQAVDCNGDTLTDIERGEPLVCYVPPTASRLNVLDLDLLASFADVIVALVENVNERATVTFEASDPELLGDFAPPSSVVDLRRRMTLPFSGMVHCPTRRAGDRVDVAVAATSGPRVLALSSIEVQCGEVPLLAASLPLAPAAAVVQPAAAGPAPPAPPAQAVSSASSSATSTASSAAQAPAPGAQGAVAGAQQRQMQIQAAGLGRPGGAPDEAPQFQATAPRRGTEPAGRLTVLAGAAVAAAVGVAELRRRRAPGPARVSVRRLR